VTVTNRANVKEVLSNPDEKKAAAWAAYDKIDHTAILNSAFTTHKVNGSNDENNQLTPGSIFLCKTNEGRLCKFLVEQYGYNLVLSWTTYNRNGEIYSQGRKLRIRGTWSCDLDQGKESKDGADFFWQQVTETERYMNPKNGALFAKLPSDEMSSTNSRKEIDGELEFKARLDYTTELSRWGLGRYRPQRIELSQNAPPGEWMLPSMPDASLRRFWGRTTFGHNTLMNVIVHMPEDPDADAWKVFVAFDENTDFTTVTPFMIARRKSKRVEFKVAYSDRTVNPYVIDVWPNSLNPGRFSLTYARRCIRTGILKLPDGYRRIAISDDNANGLYSDLQDTAIVIDGDEVLGTSSVKLGDSQFFSVNIADDGSWVSLRPASYSIIEGRITCSSTEMPAAGARVRIIPHDFETITDGEGQYSLRLPVGAYTSAQITASDYIPAQLGRHQIPLISSACSARLDVELDPAVIPKPGELTLSSSESYHFLSGQRYSRPVGGDFYYSFSKGEPKFLANNRHQGGLVDLGQIQTPLDAVTPPIGGCRRHGVLAEVGHVYVSPAKQGEEGCHIVFRVTEIKQGESCTLTYYYRQGKPIQ